MKYATQINCVIFSMHNTPAAAEKSAAKTNSLGLPYMVSVRGLLPKGELPGWERGDNPAPKYWTN